jgi:hypothetical protein
MLAWKEKVADRLARLLADSPPTSSPTSSPTAVQPQVSDLGYLYPQAACLPHIASDLYYVAIAFPVWGGWDLVVEYIIARLRRFPQHGKAGPWRLPDLGLLPWTKGGTKVESSEIR